MMHRKIYFAPQMIEDWKYGKDLKGMYDFYSFWKKDERKTFDFDTFAKIVRMFNKALVDRLFLGDVITLPAYMGMLRIRPYVDYTPKIDAERTAAYQAELRESGELKDGDEAPVVYENASYDCPVGYELCYFVPARQKTYGLFDMAYNFTLTNENTERLLNLIGGCKDDPLSDEFDTDRFALEYHSNFANMRKKERTYYDRSSNNDEREHFRKIKEVYGDSSPF